MSTPPVPLVLGHRGASADAPENTLRAFRLALEQGADGVELDVRRSADGVPVVIHDATVDRATCGTGAVAALRAADLGGLDAGGGEGVPTLRAVAEWAARTGAWLNVEIKEAGIEVESLAVLGRAGTLERTLISSFSAEAVREVGRHDARVPRFLLADRWNEEARRGVRESGAGGVCLHTDAATPSALRELAEAGLPVVVWTVDDPARLRALLRSGVRGVITNYPSRGVAARRTLTP